MHHHDAGHSLFSLVHFARAARKAPTRSEALIWAQLRGRKLEVRIRRQHPLHPFVVDFFVCAHRLAIEVDGGIHRFQRERDLARDRYLASTYRLRVLRIDAELVERDVRAAVAIIRAAL
jgi:very-short-patch-repair endonuclease